MNWLTQIIELIKSLFKWWFIVLPWEQAVRVRLGKHTRLYGKGFHFLIPFFDRVYVQNTRTRMICLSPQTVTTRDNKTITCVASLRYKITDVMKLYQTLHQPKDTISQEAEGYLAEYIVRNELKDCAPTMVSAAVTEQLDLSQYGLGGVEFVLTEFAVVRTYRLIGGEMTRWETNGNLSTNHVSHGQGSPSA